MRESCGVVHLPAERSSAGSPHGRERTLRVRANQRRVADHIRGEDRGEAAGLAHVASPDERIFFSRSTNGGAADSYWTSASLSTSSRK
jgi:hypothetical protein